MEEGFTRYRDEDVWQYIRDRMNEHRIDPKRLAKKAGRPYNPELIQLGIQGRKVPIHKELLLAIVRFCKPQLERRAGNESWEDELKRQGNDELVDLIKPPSAMPPKQGNFWEW